MRFLSSSLTLSRRGQFLVASILWTVVGFGLLLRGFICLVSGAHYYMLIMVLLLGIVKFFLVFRLTAQKNVSRVERRERDVSIGSVFPGRTWILIAVMIIMGFLIRLSPLPREVYSLVISGVGLGMLMASGIFWKAWQGEADRTDD